MKKYTCKNEADYFNLVEMIALLTIPTNTISIPSFFWKKEHQEAVRKSQDRDLQKSNFDEWANHFDVWTSAEKEYGDALDAAREDYGEWSYENVLRSFGLDPEEENSYFEDLTKLRKTKSFPKSFPCIVLVAIPEVYESKLDVDFIYLEPLSNDFPLPNFPWLKENVQDYLNERMHRDPIVTCESEKKS